MLKHPPIQTELTDLLGIKYPIIMAPMFLVSNEQMVIEAVNSGITGAIPALNYRTDLDFKTALQNLKNKIKGPFGINLIVNQSNYKLKDQLKACLDYHVDFIITSLGNPEKIIRECRPNDIKVFCDVTDQKYGAKVHALKPDGLIAVNKSAGGHAGKMESKELIDSLRKITDLPIISAGGVGLGSQFLEKLKEGACGISMGSPFIATYESPVSESYKKACIEYSAKDIVFTTKLSGTPCTVINTPYVKKAGTEQNSIEAFLNRNRHLKRMAKGLTFYLGMHKLKKAAFSATYQTVWCAGPSIEYVSEILPVRQVISNLLDGYYESLN